VAAPTAPIPWFLDEPAYLLPRVLPGGRYTAILIQVFNGRIILGRDETGYDHFW
jgi:hypothetical protein